jgi:hypothetical protein
MRKNFSHSTEDEYYTPYYAVDIIVPYLKEGMVIWCPFDTEESKYVKRFIELGYKVYYTHIKYEQDFLTYEPKFEFDIIITNPAFSIKNEVLNKCYEYNKPFCLLLPMTMFNSITTVNIINKFGDIQFIIMDRRISFNGSRPNFTCWYVCRKFLPKDIITYKFDGDTIKKYNEE